MKTRKKPGKAPKARSPYPALRKHPTPAERRAALRAEARAKGIKPITDFDRYLEEVGDFWPKEESIDDFLTWLKESRKETVLSVDA